MIGCGVGVLKIHNLQVKQCTFPQQQRHLFVSSMGNGLSLSRLLFYELG